MSNNVIFYPPDCPLNYDEPYIGNLYFLVENNPAEFSDTKTSFDKNLNRKKDDCQRRSIHAVKISIIYLKHKNYFHLWKIGIMLDY